MNSIDQEIHHYKNLTKEELQAARDFNAALKRGDREAAKKHFKKIRIVPHAVKATKEILGADYIRENYNTELADKEYGPGWLDRDD
ncbi:MAG: hypothetical protein ACR2PJ_08190 [Pseudomonadales bacterium]